MSSRNDIYPPQLLQSQRAQTLKTHRRIQSKHDRYVGLVRQILGDRLRTVTTLKNAAQAIKRTLAGEKTQSSGFGPMDAGQGVIARGHETHPNTR